jgi:dihydroorotase
MGLLGYPAIGEWMMVRQYLDLLRYTGGRIHFSGLSTAKAVQEVFLAKEEGLSVTCDVPYYIFCFIDQDLKEYDTNLKVFPPIRSKDNQTELINCLKQGQIDAISSGHHPQDIESKDLEFDLASNGMLGLELAFSALNTHIGDQVSLEEVIQVLTHGPDRILRQHRNIKEGETADLVFFNPADSYTFQTEDIKAGAKNSPFIGQKVKGRILGINLENRYYAIR